MSVVTTLLVTSRTLMIIAATVSSFFVLRIRPARCFWVSLGSPLDEWHHGDAGFEA